MLIRPGLSPVRMDDGRWAAKATALHGLSRLRQLQVEPQRQPRRTWRAGTSSKGSRAERQILRRSRAASTASVWLILTRGNAGDYAYERGSHRRGAATRRSLGS